MADTAGYQIGYLLGHIAVPVLLIAGGIYLGRRLGRRKNPPGFTAWPVLAAIVLSFLGIYGASQRAANSAESAETR